MRPDIQAVVQAATQVILSICCASLACAQTEKAADLPAPGRIAEVVCSSDSTQTYALYLPSKYAPSKRWPIIYFFDPGGRGRRPLELYKDLGETYGFIFAGSNNSRNFSGNQSQAVNAIWHDTHLRLSVDDRRVYTSGFSGGARVAGAMAFSSQDQIAGVIAHGAGYPNTRGESADKLLYYFAVGNQDFNWPEVITASRERDKQALPYRVRVFAGSHQWAPSSVMEDAIAWLQIKAMQAGATPPDATFVEQELQRMQNEADDSEKKKDVMAELASYHSMVSDFDGLRNVSASSAKLAALKQSPGFKAALRNEQDQIAEQFTIEREIAPKFSAYASGDVPDMTALRLEILQAMAGLKQQAAHAHSDEHRLVLRRAFNGMIVGGMENGQQEFHARHFDKAESCFDLMRQISDDAWPVLLLAETRAAMGNRKQAIKDLREAVRRGLKDADVIESDTQLHSLREEPEFRKLIAEMKSK